MAITHVASAAGSTSNPTITDQVTLSASIQAGDFLEVWVHNRYADQAVTLTGVTDNDTGGNTWTKKGESANGRLSLWWKIATSGTASKVVTATLDAEGAILMGYTAHRSDAGGFDADSITNLAFENNASGNEAQTGFTPTAANSFIGLCVAPMDNLSVSTQSTTSPGTLTERFDKVSSAAQDHGLSYAEALQSGGPTATGNFTWAMTNFESDSGVRALREAASGTNYDETGKQISVASTVTAVSQFGAAEGLTVSAAATTEAADQLDAGDSHQLTIISSITGSDARNGDETGRALTITSTVTGSDLRTFVEHLDTTGTTTVAGSDQLDGVEDLTVAGAATVSATDQLAAVDDLEATITSTVTGNDTAALTEPLQLEITSSITGSDSLSGATNYDETGRALNIAATVTGSDIAGLTELLELDITATVAGHTTAHSAETLDVDLVVTVAGTDQKAGTETLDLDLVVTTTGTDLLQAVETLDLDLAATVTGDDVAGLLEDLELSLLATVSGTDSQGLAIAGAVEAGQAGGSSASSGSGVTGPEAGHNLSTVAAGGLLVGSVEGG